jgi:hypothetical protein
MVPFAELIAECERTCGVPPPRPMPLEQALRFHELAQIGESPPLEEWNEADRTSIVYPWPRSGLIKGI